MLVINSTVEDITGAEKTKIKSPVKLKLPEPGF